MTCGVEAGRSRSRVEQGCALRSARWTRAAVWMQTRCGDILKNVFWHIQPGSSSGSCGYGLAKVSLVKQDVLTCVPALDNVTQTGFDQRYRSNLQA